MNENRIEGTFEERCLVLNKLIKENITTFFGGAGVSTASGIPDFRSSNGMYNTNYNTKYKPEYLLSKTCFNHSPKDFYAFYKNAFDLRKYEPNECHKKLAEMERLNYLNGIITQNVDGLHSKAGNKNIAEIHGTIYDNYCIKCGKHFDVNFIFDTEDLIPKCPHCNKTIGFVRPNIVLYEESLNKEKVNLAFDYLDNANLLIVGGTSLQVFPAASYVSEFKGQYLVIINRDETPYDKYANIIFREDINEVFKNLKFD